MTFPSVRDKAGATEARSAEGVQFLLLVLALWPAACGKKGAAPLPFCGDGKMTTGEQCDDGNTVSGDGCSHRCRDERFGDFTTGWEFNTDKAGMDVPKGTFRSDSCVDFVPPATPTSMRVRGTAGPSMPDTTVGCGEGQVTFNKLAVGDYTLEATLLGDGKPVSMPKPFTVAVLPGQSLTTPKLVFTNADFSPPPTGTFYFQTTFGSKTAASCTAASPAVAQQRLTMTAKVGGAPVAVKTKDGAALDGSAASACRWPAGPTDVQQAEKLASDWYDLRVEGLDGSGKTIYCDRFVVFVGAGVSNDSYELLVPPATICP